MKNSQRPVRRVLLATLILAFSLSTLVGIATAHGDLRTGEPEEGSTLKKPPKHAYLNFSETPSNDSKLEVFDGCGEEVVNKLERFDITLHATLSAGQPGTWKVTYDVISAEDGHETKGSYNFTVTGEKDCSDASAGSGSDSGEGNFDLALSEDSSFPIVPVVIGALVLIGGALLVRVKSSRR
jgi:methionine-rich copper-binding protein CopC